MRAGELLLANSGFHGTASRAYYAAFHAVTALFALESRTFTKHSALEAAIHRDLVKAGRWQQDLGRDFSFCLELRSVSDYAIDARIDAEQAGNVLEAARRILLAVQEGIPPGFPRI